MPDECFISDIDCDLTPEYIQWQLHFAFETHELHQSCTISNIHRKIVAYTLDGSHARMLIRGAIIQLKAP